MKYGNKEVCKRVIFGHRKDGSTNDGEGFIEKLWIDANNGVAVGLIVGIIVGLLVSILIVLEKIYRELNSKSQTNDTN